MHCEAVRGSGTLRDSLMREKTLAAAVSAMLTGVGSSPGESQRFRRRSIDGGLGAHDPHSKSRILLGANRHLCPGEAAFACFYFGILHMGCKRSLRVKARASSAADRRP